MMVNICGELGSFDWLESIDETIPDLSLLEEVLMNHKR
jgi:hypothetical protein